MFYKGVVQSVLRMMWQATKNWWIDKNLEEVGLYSIEHYIQKRQNAVVDYVATWPIFNLCSDSERSQIQ